jgi:hypothetical protein
MAEQLPEHIWFVGTGGWKVFPVGPKGWQLVIRFFMAMTFLGIIGIVLAVVVDPAIGFGLIAVGWVIAIAWFIAVARLHADLAGRYAKSSWAR